MVVIYNRSAPLIFFRDSLMDLTLMDLTLMDSLMDLLMDLTLMDLTCRGLWKLICQNTYWSQNGHKSGTNKLLQNPNWTPRQDLRVSPNGTPLQDQTGHHDKILESLQTGHHDKVTESLSDNLSSHFFWLFKLNWLAEIVGLKP